MNLQLLKNPIQGDNGSFDESCTSIIDLCHKYNTDVTDLQIADWLKSDMKLSLYKKLQGKDFLTLQDLFHRAQCVEFDNAVLDARKC